MCSVLEEIFNVEILQVKVFLNLALGEMHFKHHKYNFRRVLLFYSMLSDECYNVHTVWLL